jgi:PAS domain S-box-containing protein
MNHKNQKTSDELDKSQAESDRLNEELADARETLRAITSGEVDALVVTTELGEQVFTLQGADAFYRIALENINEGAITLTPEGTILYSNRHFAQIMRTDLSKVIGASVFSFVSPKDRATVAGMLRVEDTRGEVMLRGADGTPVPAFVGARRLRLDDTVLICAVVTDLTEQKRSREVIEVLESITDGFFAVNRDWRFTYVNKRAAENVGLKPRELVGQDLWTTFPGIVGTDHEVSYRKAMAERNDLQFETAGILTDNWYQVRVYPSPEGISIYWQDITDRRKAEEEIKRSKAELEALLEQRSALVETLNTHRAELEMQTTELRQAQEDISEARDRYLDLYDYAPVGYLTMLKDSSIVEANLTAAAMLGLERSQLINSRLSSLLTPQCGDVLHLHIRKTLATNSTQQCQLELNSTHETQCLRLTSAVWNAGTRRKHIRTTLTNITEQQQTEEALRKSETKYRTTLESITDAFVSIDRQWRYSYANDTATRILHRTMDELLGKTVWEVFPDAPEVFVSSLRRAMSRSTPVHFEVFYPAVSIWYECHVYPSPEGLSIFFADITVRKQAEEALQTLAEQREHETRHLEAILEAMPPAVVLVNAADRRFEFLNRRARELYGFDYAGHEIGSHYTRVSPLRLDGTPYPLDELPVSRSLQLGQAVRNEEMFIQRADGVRVPLLGSSAPLFDDDGNITQVVVVFEDVTERKKAEEELHRYREHLEELVAVRTQELRELSHRLVDIQEKERASIGNELHDEIGQYLTFATLLIDRAARKQDAQALLEAKSATQEAINKIRNLSSMLSPRIIRSAGVVQAVMSLAADHKKNTGINVLFSHNDIPADIPEQVALAAYRIIQESLTNVARHAGASEVRVGLSRQNDRLLLQVTDNGIGFDAGHLKRYTGLTGMKERAVALGGMLTIESSAGQGTRITAEIPLPASEMA